jgi:hypothetical protein
MTSTQTTTYWLFQNCKSCNRRFRQQRKRSEKKPHRQTCSKGCETQLKRDAAIKAKADKANRTDPTPEQLALAKAIKVRRHLEEKRAAGPHEIDPLTGDEIRYGF